MMLLDEAVAYIESLNTPLLCVDTCSLLDLMRAPMRKAFSADDAKSVVDVLTAVEKPRPKLGIIVAQQVSLELAANKDDVQEEGRRGVAELGDFVASTIKILSVYGVDVPEMIPHLSKFSFENHSRSVMERIEKASVLVQQGPEITNRAFQRIQDNRPPARQGKEMKDCVVLETYLELIETLRRRGYQEPILFLSSNTSDYAEAGKSVLKAGLDQEFSALNIEYVKKFVEVRYGTLRNLFE